jgi:AcrR family transcriptional regulator
MDMTVLYTPPRQERAKTTEQKFLDALEELLYEKSLGLLTIDEISDKACLTRSAFLKRFGSKKKALLILYGRYCEKVLASISEISDTLHNYEDAIAACRCISMRAEQLQTSDFSANRAMHELYMEQLEIAPETKALFLATLKLMKKIQVAHMPKGTGTDMGAYSATQLIFTINYNYVLKAMPALPNDYETRHQLIATLVADALKF